MMRRGLHIHPVAACGLVLHLAAAMLHADALDKIRDHGTLIWGGDQEGGGPYVFPNPANQDQLIGFEVELADLLAKELGVQAKFFQADWATLPEFLENNTIDVVLNGYEWSAERAERMLATRPYYIYQLQLLVRTDETRISSFDSLRIPLVSGRYSIGVLGGSAADVLVQDELGDRVEVFRYDGNTNAMMQVAAGVHDSTLQDLPIASFYRDQPQGRGLRFAGPPLGRGYYVMFVRREEARLADSLNDAVGRALADGRLRKIYERYHIWNDVQESLATERPAAGTAASAAGLEAAMRYGPTLIRAAGVTIFVSVLSMPIAMLLGLLIALGRLYGPVILRPLLAIYVEVIRGTPVMLQLYVIYFLLPRLFHISMHPLVAAVAGLAINYSAYEAEIYRAGLQAIPRGQLEAALALGMSHATALRRIIIPQAVRIVIPPVTNDFIALFKDTSICSVIAVVELTKQYNMIANNTTAVLEVAAMTALLYLLMSYPLSVIARRAEARLAGHPRPVGV